MVPPLCVPYRHPSGKRKPKLDGGVRDYTNTPPRGRLPRLSFIHKGECQPIRLFQNAYHPLGVGVVIRIVCLAHAGDEAVRAEPVLIIVTGVLHAVIAVMDEAAQRAIRVLVRLLKRRQCVLCFQGGC